MRGEVDIVPWVRTSQSMVCCLEVEVEEGGDEGEELRLRREVVYSLMDRMEVASMGRNSKFEGRVERSDGLVRPEIRTFGGWDCEVRREAARRVAIA